VLVIKPLIPDVLKIYATTVFLLKLTTLSQLFMRFYEMKLITITLIGLLTTACTESKFSGMSNAELAQKQRHCDSISKKSPSFAIACENTRKEVERRKN
jgi:hypothetical protein